MYSHGGYVTARRICSRRAARLVTAAEAREDPSVSNLELGLLQGYAFLFHELGVAYRPR